MLPEVGTHKEGQPTAHKWPVPKVDKLSLLSWGSLPVEIEKQAKEIICRCT